MTKSEKTIQIEDSYFAPFFKRMPISIEKGKGSLVWDEEEKRYIDFTGGWGVTCLGHSHPNIVQAVTTQSRRIMQNPNSGLTYSPVRAELLKTMVGILPANLTRIFFTNSGAEANDAALKLARKVSGKLDVISTERSFHGRTISTLSATGQAKHRGRYNSLMPNYKFIPFNDIEAMKKAINREVASVILEPIQGEGGVNIPEEGYLDAVSELCVKNEVLLIVDEIQTGFGRTGKMFAVQDKNIKIDFLTMAKGIAGGFPFGAFAMREDISKKLEIGDHGGTYCGNPLGCAVALAVIKTLTSEKIPHYVEKVGSKALRHLSGWKSEFPDIIEDARGKGLLLALEVKNSQLAQRILEESLKKGLILNVTQGKVIRIFPPLNIKEDILNEGMDILYDIIEKIK